MVSISIMSLYNNTKAILKQAGIDNYSNEAGFLVEKATGVKRSELGIKGYLMIDEFTAKTVEFMASQRVKGEPLQYILGRWEFYGLPFYVGDGVLIPRQDTETLVETVIGLMKERKNPVIYDLCSGSGCIAVALEKNLNEPLITAVEKSHKAYFYLEKNIKLNNAQTVAVMADVLDDDFIESCSECDCIVSNPPYLTKEDMENLQEEVKYEPSEALEGGNDGLYFYRQITSKWKNKLKSGGLLAFEIGINQQDDVLQILSDNGFKREETRNDLCNITRVVFGYKA